MGVSCVVSTHMDRVCALLSYVRVYIRHALKLVFVPLFSVVYWVLPLHNAPIALVWGK